MTLALPLVLIKDDGTICVVNIPRMTSAMFTFFIEQLEVYKSAIILPEVVDDEAGSALRDKTPTF